MLTAYDAPPIVSLTVFKSSSDQSLGMRIKQGEEGAVIIYHVEPGTPAGDTALSDGSNQSHHEVLTVNDHKVRSPRECVEMLKKYTDKNGRVDLVVSSGERKAGTAYVMAKNTGKKDRFNGDDMEIDGLKLRVITTDISTCIKVAAVPSSGFFSKVKMNKGDVIMSIDGMKIYSVADARKALRRAAKNYIPILTYNAFRKLKSTVMSDTARVVKEGEGEQIIEKQKIQDSYDVGDKLGEGAFAIVRKGRHKTTGKVYAIKIINRSSLDKTMELSLKDEIFILKDMNHANIMNLHDVYASINFYYLVTEYLEGGELFDRIVEKEKYTEVEARNVCQICFAALKYCHSNNVVHRDLKPENLLLQYKHSDLEIKIADFGFAKHCPSDDSLSTICGTPGYVAPEILRRQKYGTQSDMWSIGVIIFILLGGYPPFYGETEKELFDATTRNDWEFDETWDSVSQGAQDLITGLLTQDPSKRLTAADALKHPWMIADKKCMGNTQLAHSISGIKRMQAKKRLKAAMHAVMIVSAGAGNGFSLRNKQKSIKLREP